MSDLPVMLKLGGRPCVVIGGGKVATRRTTSLLEAGANVVVISPQMTDSLRQLHAEFKVKAPARLLLIPRPWHLGDLNGAYLAVIATDDPAANQGAANEARALGILINRADVPDQGDLTFPAHAHHGPITLAVHTNGISAAASAAIRRELSQAMAPHWQVMLEAAALWREKIQQAIDDPSGRRARLIALTDQYAIDTLIEQGPAALQQLYAQLADPAAPTPVDGEPVNNDDASDDSTNDSPKGQA